MPRKGIDVKTVKRIPASQVPPPVVRKTPWEPLFRSIANGEAIVIQSDEAAPSTVREALKRLQAKGKFTTLYATTRKAGENKYVTYVVNPSE